MSLRDLAILSISLLIFTGCMAPVVKRLDVPQGAEIAVIPFRDCIIAGQEDCLGSGNIAGSIFARVFSTSNKYKALPLSRPVGPNQMLTDDAAVSFARSKGFQFVLNGEVDEYYSVAPFTFRVDRAGVSLRILRVADGSVAAFFTQRKEAASNFATPDGLIEDMANHVCDSLIEGTQTASKENPLKKETTDPKKQITETKTEPEGRKAGAKVADSENVLQSKTEFALPKEQVKETDPGQRESRLETKVLDTTKPDPAPSRINTSQGQLTAIEQKKGAPKAKAADIKKTYSSEDVAKACRSRGLDLIQKKQYDEAVQEFTKAINLESKNAVAFYNRGWIFYAKGEYERAIQDFTAAIERNPNNSHSYYNRGLCYNMKLQKDKAKNDFQMACDLGDQAGCRKIK